MWAWVCRLVSEPALETEELAVTLGLPCDCLRRFHSLQGPHEAMTWSIHNLVRWISFHGDEEAVFGPQEVRWGVLKCAHHRSWGCCHSFLPQSI